MSSYLLSSPQDICSECDHFYRIGLLTQPDLFGQTCSAGLVQPGYEKRSWPSRFTQYKENKKTHAGRRQECKKNFRGGTLHLLSRCVSLLNQNSSGSPSMKKLAHLDSFQGEASRALPRSQAARCTYYTSRQPLKRLFSKEYANGLRLLSTVRKILPDCEISRVKVVLDGGENKHGARFKIEDELFDAGSTSADRHVRIERDNMSFTEYTSPLLLPKHFLWLLVHPRVPCEITWLQSSRV